MANSSTKKNTEVTQKKDTNSIGNVERSPPSTSKNRARKRKRNEDIAGELQTELEECGLNDAAAIEKKLRKVAKENSLTDDETRQLLKRFVKDDHVLAWFTLKDEDKLVREKQEAEQRAILITDTPSVPKLTRAKARELNKSPGITFPTLTESTAPELAALIRDDLHSDDEDEEYTFKEEDFHSDDEPNSTASDLDSNPRTPCTPASQCDYEESPVKYTNDGCFKIPLEKRQEDNMRIAMRTRSKLCLQQTTIEDIQSEFVPPDVEQVEMQDNDLVMDPEWMKFLNDISRPMNNSYNGDDDDPVNDPEYVASEQTFEETEDYNVNVSRKELTDLISELFDGLRPDTISIDNFDLDTPEKFELNFALAQNRLNASAPASEEREKETNVQENLIESLPIMSLSNASDSGRDQVSRRIDFDAKPPPLTCVSDLTASATNIPQTEYYFQPPVVSTPTAQVTIRHSQRHPKQQQMQPTLVPVSTVDVEAGDGTSDDNDQPDHFALNRKTPFDARYSVPYDNNFTYEYISVKKHIYSEYMEKFENLRRVEKKRKNGDGMEVDKTLKLSEPRKGFTREQFDIFQQQLRIHVQMLTQTFLQTYAHPDQWRLAIDAKRMLTEIQDKSTENASFKAWNLKGAVELVEKWERECSENTPENQKMMDFIYAEIQSTNRNSRQIPRFYPRIMDLILDSPVFMYPQYLPRIPFTAKSCQFHVFAPSESLLIALGLEKQMSLMRKKRERISKKKDPFLLACERLTNDMVHGKTSRRVWDHIKSLRKAEYYNPVKYYFEHNRAPPIQHDLIHFDSNLFLTPRDQKDLLPIAWKDYVENKYNKTLLRHNKLIGADCSKTINDYSEHVRDFVGENLTLPEDLTAAVEPNDSSFAATLTNQRRRSVGEISKRLNRRKLRQSSLDKRAPVLNINYFLGPVNLPISYVVPQISSIDEYSAANETHECGFKEQPAVTALSPSDDLSERERSTPAKSIGHEDRQYTSQCGSENLESGPQKAARKRKGNQNKRTAVRRRALIYFSLPKRNRQKKTSPRYRQRKYLLKHCRSLLTAYQLHLQTFRHTFKRSPVVQHFFNYFKALELYTDLLIDLKMFCRQSEDSNSAIGPASGIGGGSVAKRTRSNGTTGASTQANDDESGAGNSAGRNKKANRQGEHLRNMLLPEAPEEINRKDAIYAFNFYEKVEEIFKDSKCPDDINTFNSILRSFDPKKEKASDLYKKMEKLFLPDHPELAEVFLTFLLPAEAAEIGKFFEHFMVTNATTFINKLHIYFSKQPAQIRKIYNCLNELADDVDVTVKKVESKILPLLRGNQFLVDWFMQLFPEQTPPERLLTSIETINLKELKTNQNAHGEFLENIGELPDSPTNDQTVGGCQLRYINGRIFYGNRITLPAKLSFLAANTSGKAVEPSTEIDLNEGTVNRYHHFAGDCVHAIRDHGERRLASAKAEEEEDSSTPALVIDTGDDGDVVEACDEATICTHAIRLNAAYYGNSNYTGSDSVGAQTVSSALLTNGTASGVAPITPSAPPSHQREKRKSPIKKTKSPQCPSPVRMPRGVMQPMVVIHEKSNAIACAKRLKTLIDEADDDNVDVKQRLSIVARAKHPSNKTAEDEPSGYDPHLVAKVEICDADDEHMGAEQVGGSTNWSRDDDKVLLTEMQLDLSNSTELCQRIGRKLPGKSNEEIRARHKFLVDFLCRMQSK